MKKILSSVFGIIIFLVILFGLIFILNIDEYNDNNIVGNDTIDTEEEKEESEVPLKENLAMRYEICLNQSDRVSGECLAHQKGDSSYCDIYEDDNMRYWCKARVEKDSSYCYLMNESGLYYRFITCIAETANTEEECQIVKNSTFKGHEYYECMGYLTQNTSYCEGFEAEKHQKRKIDCYATIEKNASACYEQEDFKRKWDCLMRLSDDPNICEDYHQAFCDEFFKP